MKFDEKLEQLLAEQTELNQFLAAPEAYLDPDYGAKTRRNAEIASVIDKIQLLLKLQQQRLDNQTLADSNSELAELARAEIAELEAQISDLKSQLEELLTPHDPNDDKNAIVEIRAGAGGDEASLFAAELLRMYLRYAETHGLKTEILNENANAAGGMKEVIFMVKGQRAYGQLKFESGVHRVQRVPVTESQGRVHTSTATVAVLPEASSSDVVIDPKDLKIDVFRSGGHGGQSVNTTDSAVRITHLPTGLVVTNQDEKSQIKNKDKALGILRARLLQMELDKQTAAESDKRRSLIGTGDRSEKIRTYNFPQDRITDHRIGYSRSNLPAAMNGDIDDLIAKLGEAERQISQD